MKLLTSSRLFGVLLIAASLPMDPGVAMASLQAASPTEAPPAKVGSVEARMRRIAMALRDTPPESSGIGADAMSWWNGGFRDGGFRDGGFGNGGFRDGGFGNGGFWNGGFRNGGFGNGGFGNGGRLVVNF